MSGLLIVTGPPGAGKSTVAARLAAASERSVLIEGDAFFGFLANGAIEPWLPESHAQNEVVTRGAAGAAGTYADGGFDTIYDGIVGPWFLPTFAAATGLEVVDYVVVLPAVETCVERVAGRLGHAFADEPATRKMHAEFTAAEVEARHVVAMTTGDPHEVASVIAAARDDGSLRYRVER